MYEIDSNKMLRIENAVIWGLNFSGEDSKYNRNGDRNFCLDLDKELADILLADGWNVKFHKTRDDDGNLVETDSGFVNIKVNYEVKNPRLRPKIYIISNNKYNCNKCY